MMFGTIYTCSLETETAVTGFMRRISAFYAAILGLEPIQLFKSRRIFWAIICGMRVDFRI